MDGLLLHSLICHNNNITVKKVLYNFKHAPIILFLFCTNNAEYALSSDMFLRSNV